jgi:Rrf2 family protein
LHIMTALGINEGALMPSEEISQSLRANPVVIRTIVQKLNRAKLVTTVRGKSGGVRIARSPKKILLLDIYRCLAPSAVICKRSQKADQQCPIGRSMDGIVQKISDQMGLQIDAYLKKQSLADIISQIRI